MHLTRLPLHAGHTISLRSPPASSIIAALDLPPFSAASSPSGPRLLPPLPRPTPPASSLPLTITTATPPLPITASNATIPGIPSLPTKLIQKIISWEYVDLGELLPEHLRLASSSSAISSSVVILPESSYHTHRRKKRQITDIATWVQVFSTYMLVLATKHPEALPELISYQLLIVQHSQKFRYPSWLRYDIDFRMWAAQTGTRSWSQVNPQCYALAFTGQGSSSQWCPICFIDGGSHTLDCPNFTLTSPTLKLSPPLPSYQMASIRPPPRRPLLSSPSQLPPPKRPQFDHCILYNKQDGNCPYGRECKYAHCCSHCRIIGHPITRCPSKFSS